MKPSPPPEWYRVAFDEHYLTVYRHRDAAEAAQLLSFTGAALGLRGARVLDLACGGARFAEPVLGAGAERYHGLDISEPLLRAARDGASSRASFARADMRRVPFRHGVFDVVLSVFSSLGYFSEDADNREVLGEVARVLRPGGRFLADILNPPHLRRTLVPESRRYAGDLVVDERRWMEGKRVVKHIRIEGPDGVAREYDESVRLIEHEELEEWGRNVDLALDRAWGGYDGSEFRTALSPRIIVLLSKKAQ